MWPLYDVRCGLAVARFSVRHGTLVLRKTIHLHKQILRSVHAKAVSILVASPALVPEPEERLLAGGHPVLCAQVTRQRANAHDAGAALSLAAVSWSKVPRPGGAFPAERRSDFAGRRPGPGSVRAGGCSRANRRRRVESRRSFESGDPERVGIGQRRSLLRSDFVRQWQCDRNGQRLR
jgi:hypothetical protein